MKKTCFEKKVEKFFDLENFWPRLVLSYCNETPKFRALAMRSEQGESPSLITCKVEFLPLGSHVAIPGL